MKKNNKKQNIKVLFHNPSAYGFRSSASWNVYEISQKYPVVLFSEGLFPETEKILNDKSLFPNIEKIVPINYSSNSLWLMIRNNKRLYNRAKEVIKECKPYIVITGGIFTYTFPLLIRRIATKAGALNVCPLLPKYFKGEEVALRAKLISAYSGQLQFLPFGLRLALIGIKKRLGHLLYYWIMPLMVGELPFRKESSCALFSGNLGRSADYYYCFSKEDYDSYLEEGMPAQKLYILNSPYPPQFKNIYKILGESLKKEIDVRPGEKIVTFMWPECEIGIRKENLSLIHAEEMERDRIKILELIIRTLKDWKVIIKPHPVTGPNKFSEIKKNLENISEKIKVVHPSGSSDVYTEISDVIMGSAPTSLSIYNASLTCPDKPILSLDMGKELMGDGFKNFSGVEYIDEWGKFADCMKRIKSGKYHKNYYKKSETAGEKYFLNLIGLLENLSLKNN